MAEMDLPNSRNPCRNCGRWGHEHDKTKVFGDGRWHYEHECPEAAHDEQSLRDELRERVGNRAGSLVDSYQEYKRKQEMEKTND